MLLIYLLLFETVQIIKKLIQHERKMSKILEFIWTYDNFSTLAEVPVKISAVMTGGVEAHNGFIVYSYRNE